MMVSELRVDVRLKLAGTVIVSGTVRVFVKLEPVAVRDKLYEPALVVDAEVRVTVAVEPAVSDFASEVTPVGRPATERVSGPLNVPCTEPQETCNAAALPAVRATLPGLTARVHVAGALTWSVTEAVCVMPPPTAFTFNE